MNKKAIINLMLSRVPEEKKEAFIAELRAAKTKEERIEVTKKYNAALTEEEARNLLSRAGNALSDAELDQAAGGCNCSSCNCILHCNNT